jgi:hypothetical protein
MRLYELVDSDQQVLALIRPILLRAKAEGAETIDMNQLINDMDSEDAITPDVIVDLFHRHRKDLENIVSSSTLDQIQLAKDTPKTMISKFDQEQNKIKSTAIKQAMDQLK